MNWMPRLGGFGAESEASVVRLGHPLVDRYLEFVAVRARPNTVLAAGYDLKVFFETVGKDPLKVSTADILEFISVQRGDGRVVRISDGRSGLSPRTIQRRLSTLSGLFSFLVARGDISSSPVPRGLATRSPRRSGRVAPPGAGSSQAAPGSGAGRGGCFGGGAAHLPVTGGHDRGDGVGRVTPQRDVGVAVLGLLQRPARPPSERWVSVAEPPSEE